MPDSLRIGLISIKLGPYAELGKDGVRGTQLAVESFGGSVNGRQIVLVQQTSNAISESAVTAAQALIRDGIDIIIGPMSGDEGLALHEFARLHPHVTFVNGNSAAQDLMREAVAPNFFTFSGNGAQWIVGLGRYVIDTLKYRHVVTIAENYSYPFAQVGSFTVEYCRAGGNIVQKIWTPLGKIDFHPVIQALPTDIDALFLSLGGDDAVHFLTNYLESGKTTPIIGGSMTFDQTVLNAHPDVFRHYVGTLSASAIADDLPTDAWQDYVRAYQARFPKGLRLPSLIGYGYYVNTKALLLALQQVDTDISVQHTALRHVLCHLQFEAPTGRIRLDHLQCAVANNFVRQLNLRPDGTFINSVVATIPEVSQTLGLPETEYLQLGVFGRDNPVC